MNESVVFSVTLTYLAVRFLLCEIRHRVIDLCFIVVFFLIS